MKEPSAIAGEQFSLFHSVQISFCKVGPVFPHFVPLGFLLLPWIPLSALGTLGMQQSIHYIKTPYLESLCTAFFSSQAISGPALLPT